MRLLAVGDNRDAIVFDFTPAEWWFLSDRRVTSRRAHATGGAEDKERAMKKWIAGAVLAAGIVSVGGTAFAGEVGGSTNGNGPKATQGRRQLDLRFQRPC